MPLLEKVAGAEWERKRDKRSPTKLRFPHSPESMVRQLELAYHARHRTKDYEGRHVLWGGRHSDRRGRSAEAFRPLPWNSCKSEQRRQKGSVDVGKLLKEGSQGFTGTADSAAMFYGAGDIRIEEVEVPKPSDRHVLVKVAW
jgi:hypothetical protein